MTSRHLLAGVCALLTAVAVQPGNAFGATVVSGDLEMNAPVVIDPTSNPDDPETVDANFSAMGRLAFMERMPVTKVISRVTLGNVGSAASCSTPVSVRLFVHEHLHGDLVDGLQVAYSEDPQDLPASPGEVTFDIPPTTLRKGRGYSFTLGWENTSCPSGRLTSWAHNQATVDGGSVRCTGGAPAAPYGNLVQHRMWHAAGASDRDPGCVSYPTDWAFHYTMPEGWLMTDQSGSYVVSATGYSSQPPVEEICGTTAAQAGAEAVFWRETPGFPGHGDYVCMWPQYGSLDGETTDGWYFGMPWSNDGTGAPRDTYLKLDPIDYDGLLATDAPVWAFDEEENFFPQKASAFTENWVPVAGGGYVLSTQFDNILFDAAGEELAAAGSPGSGAFPPPLYLGVLGETYFFGSGSEPESTTGDYIDARGSDEATYSADSARMYEEGHADIVYGRAAHDPDDGKLWLQYWLFYYYNSFETFGVGVHEGDWEMIQIGLDGQNRPDAVTFAAHNTGYGCTWSEAEHFGSGGGTPVAYVAARSHAAYPHSGETDLPFTAVDRHRGTGAWKILPMESIVGNSRWPTWRGRWGSSTTGEFQSPTNPSEQGDKWSRPSTFHTDHRDPLKC